MKSKNLLYKDYPSLRLFDELRAPYVLTAQPWVGPSWTGHATMLSTRSDRHGDFGFFHELCHWLVATPTQRMIVEYGLGAQVDYKDSLFTTHTMDKVAQNPWTRFGDLTYGKPYEHKAKIQEWAAVTAGAFYTTLTGSAPHTIEWVQKEFDPTLKPGQDFEDFGGTYGEFDAMPGLDMEVHHKIMKPILGKEAKTVRHTRAMLAEMRSVCAKGRISS